MPDGSARRRRKKIDPMIVLGVVAAVMFSGLATRMWYLQAVQADDNLAIVQQVQTRSIRVMPERGRIFDAEGRILADNKRVLVVSIDRNYLRDEDGRTELFRRLSGPLQMTMDQLDARLDDERYGPLEFLPLKEGVSEELALFLEERWEDYPGIVVQESWRRVYPYGALASHVVGYLGAILKENLAYYRALGYEPNERVGSYGVEQFYQTELRGKPGVRVFRVNAQGRVVREDMLAGVDAQPGNDIHLSIDLDIQLFAEQALETQLMLRRRVEGGIQRLPDGTPDPANPDPVLYKAPAGSVVVLNQETGQVVAMASYPRFDLRWFTSGISSKKFAEIFPPTDDPDLSVLVNRAVSGRYNLGSSFKPLVAYAALNTGQLPGGAEYEFLDRGTYKLESIPNYRCREGVKCVFRNSLCPATATPCRYGTVNVESALAVSSDTFFYKIGEQILTERGYQPILEQEVRAFGLGSPTFIDLPNEYAGTIPNKALKRRLADLGVIAEDAGRAYYVGDQILFSIGQGLLSATPLQMAVAYGAFANGGRVLMPSVASAVLVRTPDAAPGYADITNANVKCPDQDDALGGATVAPDGGNGTTTTTSPVRDLPGCVAVGPVVVNEDDRIRLEPRFDLLQGEPLRFADLPPTNLVNMEPTVRDPIVRGLQRVINGPGVDYDYYHKATGENLFRSYPYEKLPIAGKTGTAQGFGNLPWNDSSVFGAFSLDPEQPYTVFSYLEKSRYGSQAAAPVAKCIYLALAGEYRLDPVTVAEPLNLASTTPAPPLTMRNPLCLAGIRSEGRD